MGLNFRGQANRFSELKKNKAGFQEKSAPGPRQGIGGDEPGNLKAAEARFGNIVSPTKIKKNFYGGEAYFQDGYSGKMGGAGANPITKKSKSSPLKMNDSLVQGARVTGKRFVDVDAEIASAFDEESKPIAADVSQKESTSAPREKVETVKPIDIKPIKKLGTTELSTELM
jgi:hypothetical protein